MLPQYLKPGAVIGITCPSGYAPASRVSHAKLVLENWGFEVILGATIGSEFHYFSGDDNARLADLQAMLDNPKLGAILMGRGGYGLSRIIDRLDFTAFVQYPKWICGFSDITVLHSHIHSKLGMATMHAVMCGAFKPETENLDYIQSFRKALQGQALRYEIEGSPNNRVGSTQAVLVGGNLAMLAHLTGSESQLDTKGKILFIEDIGEHLYQIDRMLYQLKRSGQLEQLKGLIIGGFTDIQDTERPFGQTIEQIIRDKVEAYNFPVAFGLPVGHDEVNFTLVLGALYQLDVTDRQVVLELMPNATIV